MLIHRHAKIDRLFTDSLQSLWEAAVHSFAHHRGAVVLLLWGLFAVGAFSLIVVYCSILVLDATAFYVHQFGRWVIFGRKKGGTNESRPSDKTGD